MERKCPACECPHRVMIIGDTWELSDEGDPPKELSDDTGSKWVDSDSSDPLGDIEKMRNDV